MKKFLDEDFLLTNETAKYLYHFHAKKMPIYDYHCHLSVKDIYEDRKYSSITDLWIVDGREGDHYKWRAMRANGVDEKYITGDADKKEKFIKWAETVEYAIGNPLYHWTHLELKRYFGIEEVFSSRNAEECYEKMNQVLANTSAREIIKNSNVDSLCTTDDPLDDLRYHKLLKEDKTFDVNVYPTFRPDNLLNINTTSYVEYIKRFESVVGYPLDSINALEKAISERIEYFNQVGCRVSDHSLEVVMYKEATQEEVNKVYTKVLRKEAITTEEEAMYRGYLMVIMGRLYREYDWAQQYHIKAMRNNSKRMFDLIGKDTGFDSINDGFIAGNLSNILSKLDSTNELPKTIVYSLNPNDNELLASLIFCFAESGVPGKMQLGSAWWFLDQKDGMEKQLTTLSHFGLLARFVGMLTDSRSFLSYTRHEYFRRILCNKVGELVENGEYPCDYEVLGKIIEDICFNNAKKYFDQNK